MIITLNKNGVRKHIKVGFSWTTLFFCPLVLLCRGLWTRLAIFVAVVFGPLLILSVGGVYGVVIGSTIGCITSWTAALFFGFTVNAAQGRALVANGWAYRDEDANVVNQEWDIGE